ncbi:hypothetical protein ACFLZX_02525 [Nanoarchaeota archaeon]
MPKTPQYINVMRYREGFYSHYFSGQTCGTGYAGGTIEECVEKVTRIAKEQMQEGEIQIRSRLTLRDKYFHRQDLGKVEFQRLVEILNNGNSEHRFVTE